MPVGREPTGMAPAEAAPSAAVRAGAAPSGSENTPLGPSSGGVAPAGAMPGSAISDSAMSDRVTSAAVVPASAGGWPEEGPCAERPGTPEPHLTNVPARPAREVPPAREVADGHTIKCHLPEEALRRMEPVFS